MKQLTISDKEARKIYPSAIAEIKTILEGTFGKDFFSQKITDRVKGFEDACLETGDDPNDNRFKEGTPDEIAYKKIKVINKALNELWVPNWNNSSERKWYPWFYMDSASGFGLDGANFAYAYSDVGSRLCFKTEELAKYAAKQFVDIYKDFFTL